MDSFTPHAGRRALAIAPSLKAANAAAMPDASVSDLRLFLMTWLGGLVFFGTWFG
jgi:hypothetical protein